MGMGIANPIGTFWTAALMLDHLGEANPAHQLMRAIESVTANVGLHTRDLGGTATTAEVTDAVCAAIERSPASDSKLEAPAKQPMATA
jgi:tartrate dehydrogenase/decarboxylase / D-malate dehydrogenase